MEVQKTYFQKTDNPELLQEVSPLTSSDKQEETFGSIFLNAPTSENNIKYISSCDFKTIQKLETEIKKTENDKKNAFYLLGILGSVIGLGILNKFKKSETISAFLFLNAAPALFAGLIGLACYIGLSKKKQELTIAYNKAMQTDETHSTNILASTN